MTLPPHLIDQGEGEGERVTVPVVRGRNGRFTKNGTH